jgi:hypothetical protein
LTNNYSSPCTLPAETFQDQPLTAKTVISSDPYI